MPKCLGLYVENNVIKYATVSKDHDNFKVEAFGFKFSDNVEETIKQIVNETYSYKVPISTNLTDEKYTYSELFNLLNQKDLNKAAKTEFEYFCSENHKNNNALEYRNVFVPNMEDKDKITSLYAYTEKTGIVSKLQMLSGFKVNSISPLPISISNLVKDNNGKNKVILNIENTTSITYIVDGNVSRVELLDVGMGEIFNNIILKENSYDKAYEICKNTTIYTTQGKNLQIDENEYIEDIMPVLYKIVEQLKDSISKSGIDVSQIYITGLATAINNIDLYFQENFYDMQCEILAPFFIKKSNIKLNIKDYIEVNSAIALALQGLGIGNKEINFKKSGKLDSIKEILTMDIGKASNKNSVIGKLSNMIHNDFNRSLDNIEKNMLRFSAGILVLIIVYGVLSSVIVSQINKKENEVKSFISDSEQTISTISNNTRLINERASQYDSMVERINEANDKITEGFAKKNALPNFLTEVMFNIPKEVQLLSIDNTSGKEIKIEARSRVYEQLGYFIAKIKNEGVLTDVTATSGVHQGDFIQVTIQGNLPY